MIKLNGGKFSLRREHDGAGDSGPMFHSISHETGEKFGETGEIHLGCSIICGSIIARSYQHQDWWLTTAVSEILEQAEDNTWVRFKTGNSVYIAKGF